VTARLQLASDFGDAVVSTAVADALFCARGLAAHDGGDLYARHVAEALAGSRSVPSHSGTVLRLLCSPGEPVTPPPPWPPPPVRPVTVSGDALEALRRAAAWRQVTAAPCLTTVHLLLGLLEDPGIAAGWQQDGYPGAGAVLQAAAATAGDPTGLPALLVPGDDDTFAEALPAPDSWLQRLPLPPEPDRSELRRRTDGRRFAAVTHVLNGLLPERGASGTAMSLRTVRRWAVMLSLRYALCLAALVVGVRLGLEGHPWAFLQMGGASVSLEILPLSVWVVLGTLAASTAPWPLSALVTAALSAQAWETREALWMKRADIGDPRLSLARLRREVVHRSLQLAGRTEGTCDDGR
jgi:hypothetical protein